MRKRFTVSLLLGVLVLASCASSQSSQPQQRSPLEIAQLAYMDTSLGYEFAMQTAVDLRAKRIINDEQWSKVEAAQKVVRALTPTWRSAIDLWASSGAKPLNYDDISKRIADALTEISKLNAGVKP